MQIKYHPDTLIFGTLPNQIVKTLNFIAVFNHHQNAKHTEYDSDEADVADEIIKQCNTQTIRIV